VAVRARYLARYRAALTNTDAEIGRLMERLQSRPDWNRTILAITGDHGEEFYERGTWHHSWNQLHREGVHVPLIIRIPGVGRQEIATPVGHLDVAPTILDFVDIPKPQAMRGMSLRPLIEGSDTSARTIVTEMFGHRGSCAYRLALRDEDWKYIYDLENPHDSKLYNLSCDPGELNNLRDTEPEMFRRFERMRLAHVVLGLTKFMTPSGPNAGHRTDGVKIKPGESDLLQEQLAALGYL
jgi:arylsulfatase A-like enzyme